MYTKYLIAGAALLTTAFAQQRAQIVIQQGTGNSASNTTVQITINDLYTDESQLSGVTGLWLTGSSGVPASTVICTPFGSKDGTNRVAKTFGSKDPCYPDGSDTIGSIVCISTYIAPAPGMGIGGSSSSAAAAGTKTTMKTTTAHHGQQPTVTDAKASAKSSSSSAANAQKTGNAASGLSLSGELFGGLALAGFGVAFAL